MNPAAHDRARLPEQPADAPETGPTLDWRDMRETDHFVQLYESDTYLVDAVCGFIGAGLPANDAGVIIATRHHLDALEPQLRAQHVDVTALVDTGQLVLLDADETLGLFMVDGMPNRQRFFATVGDVVAKASTGRHGVRAFGEMVASLWADGHQQAAIRLEELWNELAQVHKFALFCAYPLSALAGDENGRPFLHVCQAHTCVIPSETYTTQPTLRDRLRCVSVLQQKAGTVAAEVASRKQAEVVSREEHTKLAMAVAVAELGIWELDVRTREFVLSDQSRLHFGFSKSDHVPCHVFLGRIHAEDRALVEATLDTAIASASDFAADFRVDAGGGVVRWISATGRHINDGRPRLLGATLDITARNTATAMLERVVAERTQELRDTVAELEAFAYSMSHDLRTPLRSMRSYAEILIQECGATLTAHGRHYLERIAAASTRMDRLIQDILAFSRLSRSEYVPEPVDLDRLTRALVDNVRNSAASASIGIDGTLPWVMGNPTALTQCLSNLIDNALKFVAPGVVPCVRIWSEAVATIGDTCWVRVNVQDNGIGIPETAHDTIFEMFQRAGKGYEGTGIGLAIVQKAVSRMGGRVGVVSEPGRGSVFWLELKCAAFTASTI